ncbi:MAG: hydroxymethylglutaryl-CoA reductase, degradative [bacterium]|nr:hydroxymethylglutaryl-CoA reductase, degradative [bacterium]
MSTFSRIPNFYRLSLNERRQELLKRSKLTSEELENFSAEKSLSLEAADSMIENAVGVFSLPLGVAANFIVDDEPVLVPMVIEEPSIIAASSNTAKIIALSGGFKTVVTESIMIGQIQLLDVLDVDGACDYIKTNNVELLAEANKYCVGICSRGGGCLEIYSRILLPSTMEASNARPMLIIHVNIDCLDAMGANIVNTVMEGLGSFLMSKIAARLGFRILSNLADRRLAVSSCLIPYQLLATDSARDNGYDIAANIVDGYIFACRDPYRAATHNKGIMNGIDAVAIATGNDWRAIEAGAHAYACRDGQYSSLTSYELCDISKSLFCKIELPLAVGVVGANSQTHPGVQSALKLLGSFGQTAKKLAGLMASVGLAQNLGALRALACDGIQRGHMMLHHRKHKNI